MDYDSIEGTVQLPLSVYERLRDATKNVAFVSEAKEKELRALQGKAAKMQQEKEYFDTIISVWTKHLLGGKDISPEEYKKQLYKFADSFNKQGLAVEIQIEERDGKNYVKPINKVEQLDYET